MAYLLDQWKFVGAAAVPEYSQVTVVQKVKAAEVVPKEDVIVA